MSILAKIRRTIVKKHSKLSLIKEEDRRYYDIQTHTLKLDNLCERDISLGKENSIYCGLWQLTQNLPTPMGIRLGRDLDNVYNFLRSNLQLDNRIKFHGLIAKILEHINPANSINIVSEYLKNTEDLDEIRRSLDLFRLSDVDENELDEFLKKAKFSSYTKYEKSFEGDHFKRDPKFVRLKYKTEEDDKRIQDRILDILMGRRKIDGVINELYQNIARNYTSEEMLKGDLTCIKPLYDNKSKLIIDVGDIVEVKKLDYQGDSYLSEFFAIYKNKLPTVAFRKEYQLIYNRIIDQLYILFNQKGDNILNDIKNNFAGVIYDNNLFIKSEDITLYWSNRGRNVCSKDHRLTIRYKINKDGFVDGYKYNKNEDVLMQKKLDLTINEDFIVCPITQ